MAVAIFKPCPEEACELVQEQLLALLRECPSIVDLGPRDDALPGHAAFLLMAAPGLRTPPPPSYTYGALRWNAST
jgi:hypothetical protein